MMEHLLPFEKIKREVLIRKESPTDERYGKSPEKRTVAELLERGVVNVIKPKGPTSHQVSAYVQNILNMSKGGHSGTLDPNVTGVLPVAFSKATRIVEYLLLAGKEYVCIMHLHKEVDEKRLRELISNEFVGKIRQLPPVKSAIKREHRYRKIYFVDILEIDGQDVLFRIGCQAGTYIRKWCHDLGKSLGVGAHMAQLIRTKAGPFDESTGVTLQDLTDAHYYWKEKGDDSQLRKIIQPLETAVGHLPKVWVFDSTVNSVCHGSDIKVPGISKVHSEIQVDEFVAIMTLKDELVGIGKSAMTSKDMVNSAKGVAVRIDKVFMDPDVYPRFDVAEKKKDDKDKKEIPNLLPVKVKE